MLRIVLPVVAVAQLVRVLDCDSSCRGFESPQPPHLVSTNVLRMQHRLLQFRFSGPLAQLVEQLTLNQ